MTVNLNKSYFGHATVEYLGHIVGGGMVKPVAAKIEAVLAILPPTSRKQLMRFLGMVGYYRKFCKNFFSYRHPFDQFVKEKQ